MTIGNKFLYNQALPISASALSSTCFAMVDTMMVGHYNPLALGAVGLTTSFTSILNILGAAFNSGLLVTLSRSTGNPNIKRFTSIFQVGFGLSVCYALLVCMIIFNFGPHVIHLLGADGIFAAMSLSYLSVICFNYPISRASGILNTLLKVKEKTYPIFVSSLLAQIMNVVLNYLLIFGIGPFPELGVKGAALATVISSLFSLLVLCIYLKGDLLWMISRPFAFLKEIKILKEIMVMALPTIWEWTGWRIGLLFLNGLLLEQGQVHLVIYHLGMKCQDMFLLMTPGFVSISTTKIGQHSSLGDYKICHSIWTKIISHALFWILPGVFMCLVFPNSIISWYLDKDATTELLSTLETQWMAWIAAIMPLRIINIINGSGLRAVGNHRYFSKSQPISLCILTIGTISFMKLGFEAHSVWMALFIDEGIRAFWSSHCLLHHFGVKKIIKTVS